MASVVLAGTSKDMPLSTASVGRVGYANSTPRNAMSPRKLPGRSPSSERLSITMAASMASKHVRAASRPASMLDLAGMSSAKAMPPTSVAKKAVTTLPGSMSIHDVWVMWKPMNMARKRERPTPKLNRPRKTVSRSPYLTAACSTASASALNRAVSCCCVPRAKTVFFSAITSSTIEEAAADFACATASRDRRARAPPPPPTTRIGMQACGRCRGEQQQRRGVVLVVGQGNNTPGSVEGGGGAILGRATYTWNKKGHTPGVAEVGVTV